MSTKRPEVHNQQPAPSGMQFNLVPLKDLARGIDLRSAESNVQDGYCEDLVNVDTVSSGQLTKRHGYQGYGGWVPFRVASTSYNGYQLLMKLGTGVDLTGVVSSPIIVYGIASTNADLHSTGYVYYPGFSVDVRETFAASGVTSVTRAAADTGATTAAQLAYVSQSTSDVSASNAMVLPDSVTISSSTYATTFSLSPVTAEREYLLIADKHTVAGSSYAAAFSLTASGGVCSGSVSAVTHGLGNFNIIPQIYSLSGTTYTQFIPDLLTVNTSTGDVAYSFTAGDTVGQIVLDSAPTLNVQQITVGAGATVTTTVAGPFTTHFPYSATYRLNGSVYELIVPDAVVFDAVADTLAVTITNAAVSPETYVFYYDFALIAANTIKVVDTTIPGAPTSDATPQLTIWGVSQAGRYATSGGSVNHLDTYKRQDEARLLCASGGALFAARTRDEIGSTYDLPTLDMNLEARVASSVSMSPLFQPTGTSASIRTRGIITGDNVAGGYAVVTAAGFISAGVCDYTLSLTNKVGTLSVGGQVATTDYLTVSGMARSVHNGTFQIQSITSQSASQVVVRVANTGLNFADFDESGAAGRANVFTDQFTITAATSFLPGDTLTSSPATTVSSVSATTVTVSSVTAQVSLATGTLLFGHRTSYLQPLKSTANVASVAGLVRGDMVTVTGLDHQPRVTYVNPFHDMPLSLTVAAGVATASLGASVTATNAAGTWTVSGGHTFVEDDPVVLETTGTLPTSLLSDIVYYVHYLTGTTFKLKAQDGGSSTYVAAGGTGTITVQRVHRLSVGQRVAVAQTSDPLLDGTVTVLSTPTLHSFTYATTTAASSATGVMVGRTAEFDESLTFGDALTAPTAVTVTTRWIPAEAPDPVGGYGSNNTLLGTNYVRHPTYFTDTSTFMRSCMIASNSYMLNYTDAVTKFDGTHVCQAGLFRWQTQLFAYIDTTVGSLTLSAVTATVTAVSANKFTVGTSEPTQYTVGDRIVHSQDGGIYTVQSTDTANKFVYTTATITGSASGTLQKVKTYRYYARLNAIDANNNIVASAVTGSQDMVVELSTAGQIVWRFMTMPSLGVYDYDRIELQLYRTAADTVAPYYLIRSMPMTFDTSDGYAYMDVPDAVTDDELVLRGSVGDDATMIALKGAQLGTSWDQPPRAKNMCAVQNRLVLSNIKDYEQLDIVLRKGLGVASISTANLGGLKFTLKKDSTDSSSTTDMLNRCTYEFMNSGSVSFAPATDITTSGLSFTVTKVAHGLVAGNWVYLFHATTGTNRALQFAGWYQIGAVTADTFTCSTYMNNATVTAADVDRYITATTKTNVPVWLGTDGNYSAIKGANSANETNAMVKMANAINASMVGLLGSHGAIVYPYNAGFVPWVTANAGSEYASGQLVLRVPKYSSTSLQVTLTGVGSSYDLYVNNVKRANNATVSATSLVFPSRVVISYPNYPEIFDAPFAIDSDSIVDVNSEDGEEVTAHIPFFGESAFTSAQVAALVVVFKTSSVYLLDISTKQLQKIDSHGQGCTAPASVAATRDGIMFANASGVYRLNRNLTVSYVGKFIERYWKDNVNVDQLSIATATNYAAGRKYKLSVPTGDDSTNSVVLVYDHTREAPAYAGQDEGYGAWTRYTNHNATGWCNLTTDAFFATSDGQVFSLRNTGAATDYRDDAAAVAEMVILVKSIDGGVPGIRKHCRTVVTHMRMETSSTGTYLYAAVENSSTFTLVGQVVKTLDDKKVISFRSSLPTHRFVYLSIKYTNAVKDEGFVLAGVDFLLAVLGTQGVVERVELS